MCPHSWSHIQSPHRSRGSGQRIRLFATSALASATLPGAYYTPLRNLHDFTLHRRAAESAASR
jgi:hypothetical protein